MILHVHKELVHRLDLDKIAENYVFLVETTHLDSWVDFVETVGEFGWLITLPNLTDRHVFINCLFIQWRRVKTITVYFALHRQWFAEFEM